MAEGMGQVRVRTRIVRAGIALLLGVALVGCGSSGGDDAADDASTTSAPAGSVTPKTDVPKGCEAPPLTMRLEAGGPALGGPKVEITDAVARRVPILPKAKATTPADQAALAKQAAKTDLAAYSLYLSDFEIDRTELTGSGFGMVTPPEGKTVGVLSIVPPKENGLKAGDTITNDPIAYATTTTFAPVQLTVATSDDQSPRAYTDVKGQVEVLALDDDQICLAIDVVFENQGELRYAAKGTVVAPVVRSAPSFFFT